jgi:hypothetical protein
LRPPRIAGHATNSAEDALLVVEGIDGCHHAEPRG